MFSLFIEGNDSCRLLTWTPAVPDKCEDRNSVGSVVEDGTTENWTQLEEICCIVFFPSKMKYVEVKMTH